MARNEPNTHPPGRPERLNTRDSAKRDLVQVVLVEDPVDWIEARRAVDYEHPDGTVGPVPFRVLAEQINDMLHEAGVDSRVTFEGVRGWFRERHPEG